MMEVVLTGSVIGGRHGTGGPAVVARRQGVRGTGERLSQNLTLHNTNIGDNVVLVSLTFADLRRLIQTLSDQTRDYDKYSHGS
jgi:hypothetical protein